jgi:hypothetical protein
VTKGKGRADRQTALEAKVDSLMELLKRNQAIPDDGVSENDIGVRAQRQGCDVNIVTSPLSSLTMEAARGLQCASTSESQHSGDTSDPPRLASSVTTPSLPELRLETKDELQDILDTYRNKMFHFFPVVVLGPEITVEYMATNRPNVWLVLRTICNKKLARQLVLAEETKRVIASQLVVEGERSFDTLCALVLYTNWGQYFCTKANFSPCLHLAMALASDLGLLKPAPQGSPAVMLNWTPQGCPKPPHALTIKTRTMEERRVVLGLFLVSSM